MSFMHDLKAAQKVEDAVNQYIYSNAALLYKLLKVESSKDKGKFSDWDFKYSMSIEVKNDKYPSDNFAFEFKNSKTGQPTGVFNTKADYVAYATDKMYIIFDTQKLREDLLAFQNTAGSGFKVKEHAGDGSASLYLYKKEFVLGNFRSVIHAFYL